MANLTEHQRELLVYLSTRGGVVFVRGEDAVAARSPGMERLVAIGHSGSPGTVAAQITDEGRKALEDGPASSGQGGR